MKDEGRFSYESLQDAGTIAKYLQTLIEGFEKGNIVLKSNEEELMLHPKDMIMFTVHAKKKNEKTKLTLKMSWKETENSTAFSIKA